MGQRKTTKPEEVSPYKYKSMHECEIHEDAHIVQPTVWPPPKKGSMDPNPSLGLRCTLCGAWCVVHKEHATGELEGITVDLSKVNVVGGAEAAPKRGRPRKIEVA